MKLFVLCGIAFGLSACETVEHADGSTSSRFDPAAFSSLVETSSRLYDRYNTSAEPVIILP